jgi:hypothetical protein
MDAGVHLIFMLLNVNVGDLNFMFTFISRDEFEGNFYVIVSGKN